MKKEVKQIWQFLQNRKKELQESAIIPCRGNGKSNLSFMRTVDFNARIGEIDRLIDYIEQEVQQ